MKHKQELNYEALGFPHHRQWEATGARRDENLFEITTAMEKGTHWRGERQGRRLRWQSSGECSAGLRQQRRAEGRQM